MIVEPNTSANGLVVVFEDEAFLSDMLRHEIGEMGFVVEVFADASGVGFASSQRPVMIFLDISLAQSDAVEVLRLLSQAAVTCPVQLMSGGRPEMIDRVKRVGERRGLIMLSALHKPFAVADVQMIVNEVAWSRPSAERTDARSPKYSGNHHVDLHVALDNGWVEVWYQPKHDVGTLALIGAECLCRLRHPEHGVMAPGAFLTGASSDDLRRLTEFVVRQACRDWVLFKEAGHAVRLAVNIPCALLTSMPLVKLLRESRPAHAEWPGLILEVTEEQAVRDIDAANEIGTQLAIYDVEFAIDDFGVGYSSLARLREIPFREVKLDRSLVDGCANDEVRAAFCRTVIDLSHTLGAITVAEGIERVEDFAFLRGLGCDVAQGYLFARPMMREALAFYIQAADTHVSLANAAHNLGQVA